MSPVDIFGQRFSIDFFNLFAYFRKSSLFVATIFMTRALETESGSEPDPIHFHAHPNTAIGGCARRSGVVPQLNEYI